MAVALTLARMKATLLRHSLRGRQQPMTLTGLTIGLLLAGGTLHLSATGDLKLLAAVYALWMLGWALGPVAMGGSDETLKPEHFALLGLKPHRQATGLLAAAFVGLAPLVSLTALLGLLVSGIRQDLAGALTAVPAIILQLALFVLLSKVAVGLLRLALRSRIGAVAAGVINGAVLAALCQIWVFLALFDQHGIPRFVAYLPSSWGLRAIRGDYLALAGLALLDLLLLAVWAGLLAKPAGAPPTSGRPRRPITATTAQGAIVARELRTWSRDLARNYQIVFALCFGICFGATPLLLGWPGMLPYAGPIFILMAAGMTVNLYGADGTALWLTITNPDGSDVRGRQRAWLAAVGPAAAVVTLAGTAIAGGPWPLMLALLPALLGAAAGLVPLLAVYGLVPGIDPHKRGANPLRLSDDNSGLTGLTYLTLALAAAAAAPAALLALRYGWVAVPAGLVSGLLCYWGLGLLAAQRLAARAPELLHAMRTGRKPQAPAAPRLPALPARAQNAEWVGFALAAVPLFPQGVVAAFFVAAGAERHTWFLATYLRQDLRWPTVIGMIALGLVMFGAAWYRKRRSAVVAASPSVASSPPA
ncbi:hypothetical protein ACGFJ5_23655 [Micromonospora echinaurantiaca]|uniref:hypothetical protein n=1 Tax=Micromonospora echinaurantiaca TaxID=47857 RepID=UPI0037231FCF